MLKQNVEHIIAIKLIRLEEEDEKIFVILLFLYFDEKHMTHSRPYDILVRITLYNKDRRDKTTVINALHYPDNTCYFIISFTALIVF